MSDQTYLARAWQERDEARARIKELEGRLAELLVAIRRFLDAHGFDHEIGNEHDQGESFDGLAEKLCAEEERTHEKMERGVDRAICWCTSRART